MEENKNELENDVNSTSEPTVVSTPEVSTEVASEVPAEVPTEAVTEVPTEGAEAVTTPETEKPKKKKTGLIIILIVLILLIAAAICYFVLGIGNNKESGKKNNKENNGGSTVTENQKKNSPYRMSGNGLEDFDIQFLKLVGTQENVIYSPISIKYALAMLNEGTKGESHEQIRGLIGDYKASKYSNSSNLAFGNAFFVREGFATGINQDTVNILQDKYSAEVKTGSFDDPAFVNNWVNEKTLGMIKELVAKEDIQELDFIIANALGIDMEWTSNFLPRKNPSELRNLYTANVKYNDTDFSWNSWDDIVPKEFNGSNKKYATLKFDASYNNYDVVKEHGGEDNYKNEIKEFAMKECNLSEIEAEKFAESTYDRITENYHKLDKSTDFYFYSDDTIRVFAKDLKEYDGVQLQYVGFEPQVQNLDSFVKNTNAAKLNQYISKLKELKPESFEEGYVTHVSGTLPKFKYDFNMDLKEKLKSLGVTDVFDPSKADFSKLVNGSAYLQIALHSANIDFSEDGIKASATTMGGGYGNATFCPYIEKMKVKDIDVTFDKPYMYIVRNKNTGEVWFAGSVTEPLEYQGEY